MNHVLHWSTAAKIVMLISCFAAAVWLALSGAHLHALLVAILGVVALTSLLRLGIRAEAPVRYSRPTLAIVAIFGAFFTVLFGLFAFPIAILPLLITAYALRGLFGSNKVDHNTK